MSLTTDPAKEIIDMCHYLKGIRINPSNEKISSVLQREFDTELCTPYRILDVYNQRFVHFLEIIEDMQEDHLDDEIRMDAISASKVLSKLFDFGALNESWSSRTGQIITNTNILKIRGISSDLRRNFPLRKLEKQERDELKTKLGNYDLELSLKGSAPEFVIEATKIGLRDIKLSLEYYEVFGSSQTLDAVHKSIVNVRALETVLDKGDQSKISELKKIVSEIYSKIQTVNSHVDTISSVGSKVVNALAFLSGEGS